MPLSQAAPLKGIDLRQPFVFLDDASGDGRRTARLFSGPAETIVADERSGVLPALDGLAEALRDGRHVAGFIGYEAGLALEPRLSELAPRTGSGPLLWFGVFDDCRAVDPIAFLDPVSHRPLRIGMPSPRLDDAAYAEKLRRVDSLIAAGDIYQANLTFQVDVDFSGHPLALYARLRRTQRMAFGAVVWTGRDWLLSASPELFFTLEGGKLTARPMKGTAARQPAPDDDDAVAAALALDPKNRAENLMITDLIRNDFSRVAEAGSVAVSEAFTVERYPTVHQMTSTVHARLRAGLGPIDALKALFPCGSVTGAPKIRAMEIIDTIEDSPRGAYTGSIGWIAPQGDARFNVAIRTIAVAADGSATMGIGSGIVADSDAATEWAECMQKMAFVSRSGRPFHLIETMAFDPTTGIPLLELHLERMARSASHHGFVFDRHDARNMLQAVVGRSRQPVRVKLTLALDGAIAIASGPLPAIPTSASVSIAPLPVDASDWRLYHKSSDRDFYETARKAAKTDEVVFERPDGRITEGSFTNVFVEHDGELLTPPVSDGLLAGVLRQGLIDTGRAREAHLTRGDLADGFLLGNALRGLFPARLVD